MSWLVNTLHLTRVDQPQKSGSQHSMCMLWRRLWRRSLSICCILRAIVDMHHVSRGYPPLWLLESPRSITSFGPSVLTLLSTMVFLQSLFLFKKRTLMHLLKGSSYDLWYLCILAQRKQSEGKSPLARWRHTLLFPYSLSSFSKQHTFSARYQASTWQHTLCLFCHYASALRYESSDVIRSSLPFSILARVRPISH